MSTADKIAIVQVVLVFIGFAITIYLSVSRNKLDKMLTTQNALTEFSNEIVPLNLELQKIIKNYYEGIISVRIISDLESDPEKFMLIKKYLNCYERLCLGINSNIYDFNTVRYARRRDIINAYNRFSNLIEKRRSENSPSWTELEKLAKHLMRIAPLS